MGRRSIYDTLRVAFERQVAAGGRIDISRAAREAGCSRPCASRLWGHGLRATPTSAASRPLREVCGQPLNGSETDPDAALLRDVRSVVSRTTSAASTLLDGLAGGLKQARETLAGGTEISLVLSVTEQLGKVAMQLVSCLDKLATAGKSISARRPAAPARAPAPLPAEPPNEAEVRARLQARSAELGDDQGQDEGSEPGYGQEVG